MTIAQAQADAGFPGTGTAPADTATGTPETGIELQLTMPAASEIQGDAGEHLRELIRKAAATGNGANISIPAGTYHFYPETAPEMQVFISNHDQQPSHRVGIPLTGLNNVRLCGNGTRLVFHGLMLPFLIQDCEGIDISGISIACDSPLAREGRVTEVTPQSITLQLPEKPVWEVKEGRFRFTCGSRTLIPNHALAFDARGAMLAKGKAGDIPWEAKAEYCGGNTVRFYPGKAATGYGLQTGDTVVLRSWWRPHPAMTVYRTNGLTLRQVVFHDSLGMGFIAQRSRDILIDGGGCRRDTGRMHTTGADATHFSNCAGTITVQNALYEGMMDDAINVHATCLRIVAIDSPTEITAEFVHPQAYGFDIAEAGEHLRFLKKETLEESSPIGIEAVEKISDKVLKFRLCAPIPEGIRPGDALENADWHPKVIFRNNIVRHNRARGALFTTPEPVLAEGNHFYRSSGSAILLAGDANGWYESGSCRNVTIRNNVFEHNLTSLYQFTNGIISICPEIPAPEKQSARYHRNINICNNIFITHRVPLLYAVSADGLRFTGNNIVHDGDFPAVGAETPYLIRHCNNCELQPIQLP